MPEPAEKPSLHYNLASNAGYSYELLSMHDIGKHSAVLENVVGFARLDA